MMSGVHWKNDEISFQNVYEHMDHVNKRKRESLITYCHCYFFVLWVPFPCLHDERMHDVMVPSLHESLRTHKVFTKYHCFYLNYHKFSIKSYVLDVY